MRTSGTSTSDLSSTEIGLSSLSAASSLTIRLPPRDERTSGDALDAILDPSLAFVRADAIEWSLEMNDEIRNLVAANATCRARTATEPMTGPVSVFSKCTALFVTLITRVQHETKSREQRALSQSEHRSYTL